MTSMTHCSRIGKRFVLGTLARLLHTRQHVPPPWLNSSSLAFQHLFSIVSNLSRSLLASCLLPPQLAARKAQHPRRRLFQELVNENHCTQKYHSRLDQIEKHTR